MVRRGQTMAAATNDNGIVLGLRLGRTPLALPALVACERLAGQG
jgi:hypothetical protein